MNKYEILPSSCFGFICRTCLMYNELYSIDEVNWEGVSLKEIIQEWNSLELEEYDQLPKQMCNPCIKLMYQTYHFLSKCKRSERTLKDILLRDTTEFEENLVDVRELHPNFVCVQKDETVEEQTDNNKGLSNSVNINIPLPESNTLPECTLANTDSSVANSYRLEIKKELSCEENKDEMSAESDSHENKLHEIEDIKRDITKIRSYNKSKLRQKMKAKLLNYKYFPKGCKMLGRKGPPHKCGTCETLFRTQDELKTHINDTHKKFYKFLCDYCDSRYSTESQLVAHRRIHTGEKPYQCRTCGDCFTFKSVLKRHMVRHMEVKPHRCRYCEKDFTRKHILDQHERKHTGKRLLCRYCGTEFDTPKKLSHHERSLHPSPLKVTTSVTETGYQCDTCGKVLQSEKTLHAHILLHGPRNFKCETCGKSFTTSDRLQLHSKMTHESTMYWCHLCDNKYRQKSGLIGHLESQHETNNYFCEECGKKFVYKGSLRQHLRVHSGDSKYQCRECQKVCLNKRRLEAHIRTHTGEKPFTCEICGKCFAEKANFQSHHKLHSRDKNYACNVCEKIFLDFRSLKRHISLHI